MNASTTKRGLDRHRLQPLTGCWLWTGYLNHKGYGVVWINGRGTPAHRAAWQRRYGLELPRHLQLDHLCKTRRCVNPDHLEVVTATTNNRRRAGIKLDEQKAAEIRNTPGTTRHVAALFGLSQSLVQGIRAGTNWGPDDTREADHYNQLAAEMKVRK